MIVSTIEMRLTHHSDTDIMHNFLKYSSMHRKKLVIHIVQFYICFMVRSQCNNYFFFHFDLNQVRNFFNFIQLSISCL